MSKSKQYLCTNHEGRCPLANKFVPIVLDGPEEFVCPCDPVNCKDKHLIEAAPPEPWWKKSLKRGAVVGIPIICVGFIWLYMATRPPPPFAITVTRTNPPTSKIHTGDSVSWTFSIMGGKPSERPKVSVESLTSTLVPNSNLRIEKLDDTGRKLQLTVQSGTVQTGRGEIKITVGANANIKATNLTFEVVVLGPPSLVIQSSDPLLLKSDRDSLVLPFTVSDEKTDSDKLNFSAVVDPAERVTSTVQSSGTSRTVTLSRIRDESGTVHLAVRVVTLDGRETNQTYDINIEPPIIPIVIKSISPALNDTTVRSGQDINWTFAIDGGAPSQRPTVSAETLSPSILPQRGLILEPVDDSGRNYKLIIHTSQSGPAEIKIVAKIGDLSKEVTFTINVAPLPAPTITLQNPSPLVIESNRDSLIVWFKLSDEIVAPKDMAFSADITPADRASYSIKEGGDLRIITLSRIAGQDGVVKLNAHVAASGREANQSYDVVIEPVPAPPSPQGPTLDEQLRQVQRLLAMGQKDTALAKIEGIIVSYPRSAKALRIKGSVLYSLKRSPEAIECCEKALAINPQEGEAWFVEGAAYEAQSNFHDAIRCYDHWRDLTPGPDPRKATVEGNESKWREHGAQ
jgi:hypothetical protein